LGEGLSPLSHSFIVRRRLWEELMNLNGRVLLQALRLAARVVSRGSGVLVKHSWLRLDIRSLVVDIRVLRLRLRRVLLSGQVRSGVLVMVSLLSAVGVLLGIFLMLLGVSCLRLRRLLLIVLRYRVVRAVNSLFLILVLLRRLVEKQEEVDMPKDLEKIKNDIMKSNPKMKESMAYALATNILKRRKRNK
jgi:hypothetical protein